MIVSNVKVPVSCSTEKLHQAIRKAAGNRKLKIESIRILKRSIDARKKPDVFYVMKLAINEGVIPKRGPVGSAIHIQDSVSEAENGTVKAAVVGAGPAGLFAALTLQRAGVSVTLLERGKEVSERTRDVRKFWETGELQIDSNVQFGEGGAGTFSDGKLNTATQDPDGLNMQVLTTLYDAGAAEEILYDSRPHIGTDVLMTVVRNLREAFLQAGGTVKFSAHVTGITETGGQVTGLTYTEQGVEKTLDTEYVVLAVGHSARDTFYMLRDLQVRMEPKPFALGIRMEHPQEMITMSQYGSMDYEELGAAPYKVTAKTAGGRGVYSFCMCPGGYVVNASSEPGKLCINGMSYAARDSHNANAGIVVQVTPEDYPSSDVLSGVEFQRELEERAYRSGHGKIPLQTYGDLKKGVKGAGFGAYEPCMKGQYEPADLREVLPEPVLSAILEAIPKFGRMIQGFDREDAILSAVEARTSSPVRILRDENGEASLRGLYPAGEGAGYAGGITSAAMDGIRTANRVIRAIIKKAE